jgi:hypothetical protein
MIIWCASYPRSGSSYFRTLFNRIYGIKNISVYNEKDDDPKLMDKSKLFAFNEVFFESHNELPEYILVQTHEMPSDDRLAIYLIRDGRDALVSYAWYIINVEKVKTDFRTALKNVIENPGYFGGWSAHVLSWIKRIDKTAVIKFENLVTAPSPNQIIEKALVELKLGQIKELGHKKKLPTFDFLNQKNPNHYRRGKIGGWKDEMPPDLHALFWKKHGHAMREMGYSYD